jgi:hypothetical protein
MNEQACVVNLGPRETRRRLLPGIGVALSGVAMGILSINNGWGVLPRLVALGMLAFGVLGILQAMSKT